VNQDVCYQILELGPVQTPQVLCNAGDHMTG
jgi:hypothetical protein